MRIKYPRNVLLPLKIFSQMGIHFIPQASHSYSSLCHLPQTLTAKSGEPGKNKQRFGKDAEHYVAEVTNNFSMDCVSFMKINALYIYAPHYYEFYDFPI